MKAVWKGAIQFGLVEIPIRLYSAVQKQSLGFNVLHAKCKTPVNYQRVCPKCKKKVEWSEIVKGMRLSDGSYFVMTTENLKKLKPEKTDEITIVEAVDHEAINPIYYDSHYYIAPSKVTDKPYYLLLKALEETDKIAIGKFVMRDREHICAIQPYDELLLLSTLNYLYEIREPSNVEELAVSVHPRINATEMKLAEQLVKKLSRKKFEMGDFKDTFAQQLKERIRKKTKGKEPAKGKPTKRISRKKVEQESLMDSLKASVTRIKPTSRRPVAVAKSKRSSSRPAKKTKRKVATRKKKKVVRKKARKR